MAFYIMKDYAFVLDAQGFTSNGNFIAREVSLKSPEGEIHQEFFISPGTDIDPAPASFNINFVHGLF